MTTSTIAPYRSQLPAGRDGFAQLLHAEWTKFRTVRGWLIGMAVAALVTVALGVLTASGSQCSTVTPSHPEGVACSAPLGPGGEAVTDQFYFVHQPLATGGSITVRVSSLTGLYSPGGVPAGSGQANLRSGLQPWAKAGIIIKASTRQGSAYAAMMVTGSHGVRMQYDYTQDTAGLAGAVSAATPRWLRLTRTGDVLTGYDSADGTHWAKVAAVRLAGLPSTAQAGLFAASPPHQRASRHLGGGTETGGPAIATAVFDHVSLHGGQPHGAWHGEQIGAVAGPALGGFQRGGGTLSVSGSGDIAPAVRGAPGGDGQPIERTLAGAFAGLIAVVVVAAMFITAEYRRGLIRTTLAASPRRGRVLAAKAIVAGSVTFVAGLAAAAAAVPLGTRILRANGNVVLPVTPLTEVRIVAGTAALLAVAAVFAVGTGAVLRHSAGAVTAVIVAVALPYILATASVLPIGPSQWLLRLTPAAGFAVQQSIQQYPQVDSSYSPLNGYFPLAPWAGFAVLCGYAALTLGLAFFLLRGRDA
jgi:ABC-type transport system involved in multi-copper enzyme maturation permease subunit